MRVRKYLDTWNDNQGCKANNIVSDILDEKKKLRDSFNQEVSSEVRRANNFKSTVISYNVEQFRP